MAAMQIPNNSPGGDRRMDGSVPLTGGRGVVTDPNTSDPGDRRSGTMPLGGSTGVVKPPNEGGFSVGHSSQASPK